MLTLHFVILAAVSALVQCQRGSFARPIGFPEILNRTTTTVDPLGNRFGEANSTTERLPLEANGDRDLVERISKWPIDNQPFWYLNWKALEEQRKNPQTYPQRPSQFGQPPNFNAPTGNAVIQNSNAGTLNSDNGTSNSNNGTSNSNNGTSNSNNVTSNSNNGTIGSNNATLNSKPGVPNLGNRNAVIETNSSHVSGRPANTSTGPHGSGYGHHSHNRYGT